MFRLLPNFDLRKKKEEKSTNGNEIIGTFFIYLHRGEFCELILNLLIFAFSSRRNLSSNGIEIRVTWTAVVDLNQYQSLSGII